MEKTDQATTSETNLDFWERVRESAKAVQTGPAWMKAGITLNETHFTTYAPKRMASSSGNDTSLKK